MVFKWLASVLVGVGCVSAASASDYIQLSGPWSSTMMNDPMEGTVTCVVRVGGIHEPSIAFFLTKGAHGVSGSVIADLYPGEDVFFKVDENAPVSGSEGLYAGAATSIADQIMRGGRTVMVKYIDWPYGTPNFYKADLAGAANLIQSCKEKIK